MENKLSSNIRKKSRFFYTPKILPDRLNMSQNSYYTRKYDAPLQHIGQQVQQRRKALGLTQTEPAMLCNLSINGISNIEQGRSDFRWSTLLKIGEILGFEIQL